MAAAERVLIVGCRGMLGRELVSALGGNEAEAAGRLVGLDLPELDITDSQAVARTLAELRPTLVINAAAYTDVDGCEAHLEQAMAANAEGSAHLAVACRTLGARLVHVSTDYVFDGRAERPYEPDHPVDPQSVYGRSKELGERRVRESLADHAIVRTSWLFGVHGRNFVKTIFKLAFERSELRVVTDQVGRPTAAADLAEALLAVARCGLRGTCHFANAGQCSWFEFASEIVRQSAAPCRIEPQTSAELNRPAPRPAYSVLSTESFTAATGIVPRPWQQALAECLATLGSPTCPR